MRRPTKTLKASPARTVEIELPEDGFSPRFVLKRFHHPGRFQAARDGARARNEYQVLRRLHAKGLRVPRPIDVFDRDGEWVVRMELVPEARPLEDFLRHTREARGPGLTAIERLGRDLARLLEAGVVHPDLHTKNVLVDGDGNFVWIDFHGARLVRRVSKRELERVLLQAAADLRELLPVASLLRGLLAFRAALGRELRSERGDWPARLDPATLARRGRSLRREKIAAGEGRWLRASSLCRHVELLRDAPFFVRRSLSGERVRALAGPVAPAEDGRHLVLRGSKSELRRRWRNAGRLFEHGVRVLEPILLTESSTPWAAFATTDVAEIEAFDGWQGGPLPARLARPFGALLGRLHDRGLDLEPLAHGDIVASGERLYLAPPARVLQAGFGEDADEAVRFRILGGALPSDEARAPFLAGYLAEFPGRSERAGIARALSR